MSLSKKEQGKQTVMGWLSAWEKRRRELICSHMVSDELITLKEKPVLAPYKATYLRHAIGEYARVRLGISTVLLALGSKEEKTPVVELLDVTERVVHHLTNQFYLEKKHRKSWLKATIQSELEKWIANDMMQKIGDAVRVEPVVPELVIGNHFGPLIYHSCGRSSWKRCVTSGVVGIAGGIQFWDIPKMISDFYSGADYGYRRRHDPESWWLVHGEEGSMFALRDKANYTYLQYNAKRYDEPVEVDSDVLHNVLRTVKSLLFINSTLLKKLYGAEAYLQFLETIRRFPEVTPLKLGENFVHHGLAYMLKLGLEADIKEHVSSTMLSVIYEKCNPRIDEVESLGSTIKSVLHELTTTQEFKAKSFHERNLMHALEEAGLVRRWLWTDTFKVREGMRDATALLSRFVGNIFDR